MLSNLKDAWTKRARQRVAATLPNSALSQFLQSSLPKRSQHVSDTEFLVADLEMSGLNPKKDKILSIGTALIRQSAIDHSASTHQLVHQSGVDLHATAPIHRIFDQHVSSGLALETAFSSFLGQLQHRVLVLHHAHLDKRFLDLACQQLYGTKLHCYVIDTFEIERQRQLQRGHEPHQLTLSDCRKRYNLPNYTAHNAAIDALATAELFLAQLSAINAHGSPTLGELI